MPHYFKPYKLFSSVTPGRTFFSAMPIPSLFLVSLFAQLVSVIPQSTNHPADPRLFPAEKPQEKTAYRLSKPLIGDDGRIYCCSQRNLFAFDSNGSIAWSVPLNYTCDAGTSPIHGGKEKIYLVAENRVLKIIFSRIRTFESTAEVFLGPQDGLGEIIGLSVSTLASSIFINIKNRGLFAYTLRGQLLWSAGPVLYRSGYRQGCMKNVTDCYFTSVPVIDQCEASIYISNSEGELYSLSIRSPYFKWVRDLSSFDKIFTITAGNNGRLYVTVPARALLLAIDATTGDVLWQKSIGPLSTTEYAPVVDSNGWISIGSFDGFLYSFSPTGVLKKFSRGATLNSVIQVSPLLDCSGYGVYICLTEMEGKISRTIGDYIYISALKPKNVVFTMLVPSTGSIYWSESYPGRFSSLLSDSDLQHFVLNEEILLAFAMVSRTGNLLPCRTKGQKLASSCSQVKPKFLSIYTGNEKAILLFLLFETIVLIILAGLVRFCCIFWSKKKLQGQHLGNFLEKRRSLQLKKKAFGRTITELEIKAVDEAVANAVLEKLGDLVRGREGVEKKLSTTYSLGRDGYRSKSKSSELPLYNGKKKSYSFQGAKKGSVTIFHTLSDTSSGESSSSEKETDKDNFYEDKESAVKAKAPIEVWSSSDDGSIKEEEEEEDKQRSPSASASSSNVFMTPLSVEHGLKDSREVNMLDDGEAIGSVENSSRSTWLKRRRTLSSTN